MRLDSVFFECEGERFTVKDLIKVAVYTGLAVAGVIAYVNILGL